MQLIGNLLFCLPLFSYSKIISFNPSDYLAWNNKGFVFESLKQYKNAIVW